MTSRTDIRIDAPSAVLDLLCSKSPGHELERLNIGQIARIRSCMLSRERVEDTDRLERISF